MHWKSVIAELQSKGFTQPQIAAACGCRQTTISALATGKTADPRDSLGQALRRLLADSKTDPEGAGAGTDRRDPARPSPYVNTDVDRRAPVGVTQEL